MADNQYLGRICYTRYVVLISKENIFFVCKFFVYICWVSLFTFFVCNVCILSITCLFAFAEIVYIFCQRNARPFSNWARSYHNRLSKKWATILSRSFSQKVSQIRSWNFTIWSGSFPIIFKEYQKEQFRIYPNKAQNLEKNILFFLKKYILRFGFIKKI